MGTRLYRSRDDRMLAGVAGGLAELWDADPSLVRIVWALLDGLDRRDRPGRVRRHGDRRPGGGRGRPGSRVRVDAATGRRRARDRAVRRDRRTAAASTGGHNGERRRTLARAARRERRAARDPDSRTGAIIIGGLLVVVGGFFLVREYLPTIDFDWFWPAALVLLGVVVLVSALRPGRSGPGGP